MAMAGFFEDLYQGVLYNQLPIYDGMSGPEIGWYQPDEVNNLCQGVIHLTQTTHGPAANWYVRDDWWGMVPLTKYCLAKGKVPTWAVAGVTPAGATMPSTVTVPGATGPETYTAQPDGTYSTGGKSISVLGKNIPIAVLIGGGAAAVILLIILTRGK